MKMFLARIEPHYLKTSMRQKHDCWLHVIARYVEPMLDPLTQAKVIFDYLHHRFVHLCKKGTQALSTLHFNKSSTNVALTQQSVIVTEAIVVEHLRTFVSLMNKVKRLWQLQLTAQFKISF